MDHIYNNEFYDYIDAESCESATQFFTNGLPWLKPDSVLDAGCGRGAWLRHWLGENVADVIGIDGDFVDRSQLHIDQDRFAPLDLANTFNLDREFELVQSLEVAEHLPPASSEGFVASLCAHGKRIVFSAAVPGQGGEHHVNERPLDFWQELFFTHGYSCYDCIRPNILNNDHIRPWYRYNALLYVHADEIDNLPAEVRKTEVKPGTAINNISPLSWRLRLTLVGMLPSGVVTKIAKINARSKASKNANV